MACSLVQKLRCDKLMGQVTRLQTDYDRLSLRNDLGLTKLELEQIAKRMPPPAAKVGPPAGPPVLVHENPLCAFLSYIGTTGWSLP